MTETMIHIVDGSVVLNPEPEPTFKVDFYPETAVDNMSRYNPAPARWKKNCILCENAKEISIFPGCIKIDEIELSWFNSFVTPGTKVLADGNVIKGILWKKKNDLKLLCFGTFGVIQMLINHM